MSTYPQARSVKTIKCGWSAVRSTNLTQVKFSQWRIACLKRALWAPEKLASISYGMTPKSQMRSLRAVAARLLRISGFSTAACLTLALRLFLLTLVVDLVFGLLVVLSSLERWGLPLWLLSFDCDTDESNSNSSSSRSLFLRRLQIKRKKSWRKWRLNNGIEELRLGERAGKREKKIYKGSATSPTASYWFASDMEGNRVSCTPAVRFSPENCVPSFCLFRLYFLILFFILCLGTVSRFFSLKEKTTMTAFLAAHPLKRFAESIDWRARSVCPGGKGEEVACHHNWKSC